MQIQMLYLKCDKYIILPKKYSTAAAAVSHKYGSYIRADFTKYSSNQR